MSSLTSLTNLYSSTSVDSYSERDLKNSVILGVIGNVVNAVGYIIQKRAHMENARRPVDKRRPFLCNGMFLFGFLVFGMGSALVQVSMTLGPTSILSSLQALTLAANTLLAPIFLGEELNRTDALVTVLIMIGCALVVVFGSKETASYTIEEIQAFCFRSAFLLYLLVMVGALGYLWAKVQGLPEERNNSLKSYRNRLLATACCLNAGFAASLNHILGKAIGEIVETSIKGNNEMGQLLSWIFIALFILSNIAVEYWKQRALAKFDALYVIPVYQVEIIRKMSNYMVEIRVGYSCSSSELFTFNHLPGRGSRRAGI